MEVPLARPLFGPEESDAVARVLRSGWVMQGPEVEAFEREFAAAVGAPHACAVSSGTAALHLALAALGVGAGDQVVTVSHSFIATANCVRHAVATPVFVDIEPTGFNLDPSALAAAITPATRAILCVHQLGMPCDLSAVLAVAQARGLPLIEDAACAVGSEIAWQGEWQRIGRPHGQVACFSFHPRKVLTTGDGGMLTTSDPELDRRWRRLRNHDLGGPDGLVRSLGWNYRMTDLQAAVGRVQLVRLPALIHQRRTLAARYRELLSGLPLVLPDEPSWARSNWQSYCVLLPEEHSSESLVRALAARSIAARSGIANAHQQPLYQADPITLPRSEQASRRGLMLPLYPGMTAADQERVARELGNALSKDR